MAVRPIARKLATSNRNAAGIPTHCMITPVTAGPKKAAPSQISEASVFAASSSASGTMAGMIASWPTSVALEKNAESVAAA